MPEKHLHGNEGPVVVLTRSAGSMRRCRGFMGCSARRRAWIPRRSAATVSVRRQPKDHASALVDITATTTAPRERRSRPQRPDLAHGGAPATARPRERHAWPEDETSCRERGVCPIGIRVPFAPGDTPKAMSALDLPSSRRSNCSSGITGRGTSGKGVRCSMRPVNNISRASMGTRLPHSRIPSVIQVDKAATPKVHIRASRAPPRCRPPRPVSLDTPSRPTR